MSDQYLTQEEVDQLLAEFEDYLGTGEPEKSSETEKSSELPELPECSCDIRLLMLRGCNCGGL